MADDFSPIYAGDTGAKFAPTFQYGDGTPFNLTGLTLSMKMVNEANISKIGTGTWTIDNASTGQAHYQYSSADVNTPGVWSLYIVATDGSGNPVHGSVKTLEILSAP